MKIKIYFTAALSEPESEALHKLVTKVTCVSILSQLTIHSALAVVDVSG